MAVNNLSVDDEMGLPPPPPPVDYEVAPASSALTPPPPPIEFETQVPGVVISPQAAWQRALKYDFGLGSMSPGVDQLFRGVNDPRMEEALRRQTQVLEEIRLRQRRGEAITDLLSSGDEAGAEAVANMPDLSSPPNVILENLYAGRIVDAVMENSYVARQMASDAFIDDPERTADLLTLSRITIARKESFQKLLEEVEHRWKNSGWSVGTTLDIAEQFVPFLSWYRLSNTVPETQGRAVMPGAMMRERVNRLWAIPLPQAQEEARTAIEQLYASNPLDAINFARALVGFSQTDEILGNAFGVVDVVTGPGAVIGGIRATTRFGRFLRDVTRSTTYRTTRIAETLDAAGDTSGAARSLVPEVINDANPAPRSYADLRGQVMSLHNPTEAIGANSTALSREELSRLERLMVSNRDRLEAAANDIVEIPRLSDEALAVGARDAEELFRLQYPQLASDRVINVRPKVEADVVSTPGRGGTRVLKPSNTFVSPGGVNFPEPIGVVPGAQGTRTKISLQAANDESVAARLGTSVVDKERLSEARTSYARAERELALLISQAEEQAARKGRPDPELMTAIRESTQQLRDMGNEIKSLSGGETNTRSGSLIVHERGPNVDHIAVELGNARGGLFESAESAEVTARDLLGLTNYTIEQRGSGYYIQVTKNINETSPSVRGFLEFENKNIDQTGRTFLNWLGDKLFGPENILSKSVMDLRKVAAYGTSGIEKQLQEVLKPLVALSRSERKDFVKFANRQRDYINPETKQRGRFSGSQGDFESEWLRVHNRMPTAKESEAYWTYVQLYDFDWVLRNSGIYRDKSRLGLEVHSLGGSEGPKGVEGKVIAQLPWNSLENTGVLLLEPGKPPRRLSLNAPKTKETIEGLGGSYRVVQLSPDGEKTVQKWIADRPRPIASSSIETAVEETSRTPFSRSMMSGDTALEGNVGYKVSTQSQTVTLAPETQPVLTAERRLDLAGDAYATTSRGPKPFQGPVDFVVTRELDSAKLPFQQIPRKPGGHVAYPESGFYASIPNIRSVQIGNRTFNYYYGEKNLYRFATESQATKFVDRLNEATRIMLTGDDVKLADFLKRNFPDDLSVKKFKQEVDGHVFVKPHNQALIDAHKLEDRYVNVVRRADSEFNLYRGNVDMQYAQERGQAINTIQELGTQTNPVFKFVEAPTLDPLATIDRAVSHLIRGRYMDDLKLQNAERFIAEFHDLLKPSLQELRSDPLGSLFNAEFKPGVTDQRALGAAKAFRRAAKEFMHIKTPAQEHIDSIIQRAADQITPGSRIEEPWLLKLKDAHPLQTFKSWAFHAYLGFFNIRQIPVQASTALNAIARSPLHGGKAAGVASGIEVLLIKESPEMISAYGSALSKAGIMSRENFIQAFEGFKRSGMWNVGKEVAYRDAMAGTSLMPTRAGYFLREASVAPFNVGERFNRATAWFTSYMEWKAANPKAEMTDKVMRSLISRADSLTSNMSRASKAWWENNGWTSVPLQFMSYKARLANQFIGKQLTWGERARLMGMYSALWGVPVAAGAAAFFWPVHQEWRQRWAEAGVNITDNAWMQALTNGIPGLVDHFITEGSGTRFNWGESFGPAGDPFLRDLIDGREGFFQALSGASGSLLNRTFGNASPLSYALWKLITGQGDTFPLQQQDFIDAAGTISTFNNAQKAWFAFESGKYMAKNGVDQVSGISGFDALLIGALGVKPQEISDMEAQLRSDKTRAEYRREISRTFTREITLAFKAANEQRDSDYYNHWRRAETIMEASSLNPTERARIVSQALRGNRDMVESVAQRFARTTPERLEAYFRHIERRQRSEQGKQ